MLSIGFRHIAIDDLGTGHSRLQSLIELNPDFVKLDRYFAKDLVILAKKQYIIEFLLQLCEKCNSQLIIEGIEDQQSLICLKNMGIKYAQGFFLGKPSLLSMS